MAQHQILVITFVVVVIGMAVLTGVGAYNANATKENWDQLLLDAHRIAGDVQQWKSRPELFGGSPDDTKSLEADFRGVDFRDLPYTPERILGTPGMCFTNLNGNYHLVATVDGAVISAYNLQYDNLVTIRIEGPLEEHIIVSGEPQDLVRGGRLMDGSADQIVEPLPCEVPTPSPPAFDLRVPGWRG
ncbi:MAG: hypothetical protein AAF752_12575 [Bacteroidota bacterium]